MFELQHFAMVHAFLLGPTFSLCTYSALSINFGLDHVQLAIASDLQEASDYQMCMPDLYAHRDKFCFQPECMHATASSVGSGPFGPRI